MAAGGEWVFACSGTIFTRDPPPPSGSPANSQWQQPFALTEHEKLTLDANGHAVTVDGNSMSRLFVVPKDAVLRMRGIALRHGAILGDGTLLHRFGGLPGTEGDPGGDGAAGSGAASPNGGISGPGTSGETGGVGGSATTSAPGGAIYNGGTLELDHVTLARTPRAAAAAAPGGTAGTAAPAARAEPGSA